MNSWGKKNVKEMYSPESKVKKLFKRGRLIILNIGERSSKIRTKT